MAIRSAASPSLRLVLLAALLTVSVLGACGTPSGSARPSPSLVELEFTPIPSAQTSSGPTGSPGPTLISWPIGWDVVFCALMTDTVVAQELVIDIERALDDGNAADARGLANELTLIAAHAGEIVPTIPPWQPAEETLTQIQALLTLDAQAATEYTSYFETDKRAALKRARALGSEIVTALPSANEALTALADLGVSCPGTALTLEVAQPR